jgi:thiamine kinase-like enzyme
MRNLLDSIALIYQQEAETLDVDGWKLSRIGGGMNGLVYRAERENGRPLAVKICQRDERHRARREYAAMTAMNAAGLDICPQQIYFAPEPAGLPGEAVISEWMEGRVLEAYPAPDDHATWEAVLESLAQVHSLTPEESRVGLLNAAFYVRQPEDMLREIHNQLGRLPEGKIGNLEREQLEPLVKAAEQQTPLLRWEHPVPTGLIHCDPNARNIIECDGMIRLVDWENSGWADPAFDIADLCANPFYGMGLPPEHHAWMRDTHSRLIGDPHLPERAALFTRLLHVWWVLRYGRYLTEANTRLKGVDRTPTDAILAQQAIIWERACGLFGIKAG